VLDTETGVIAPERLIRLPLRQLAPGRKTKLLGGADNDKRVPFPAAIAVVVQGGAEKLLIAYNLSDDVLLLDAATCMNIGSNPYLNPLKELLSVLLSLFVCF